jgi:WhiB family redox-sensing transcriptional regulator
MAHIPAPPSFLNAACRGKDPSLFHPARGDKTSAAVAKALCAVCPELVQCRVYAMSVPQLKGIWGGLSQSERTDLRRHHKE